MKVINREERPKSFVGFLAGLCAIIGGTLTVAAAVDRGLFEGATRAEEAADEGFVILPSSHSCLYVLILDSWLTVPRPSSFNVQRRCIGSGVRDRNWKIEFGFLFKC